MGLGLKSSKCQDGFFMYLSSASSSMEHLPTRWASTWTLGISPWLICFFLHLGFFKLVSFLKPYKWSRKTRWKLHSSYELDPEIILCHLWHVRWVKKKSVCHQASQKTKGGTVQAYGGWKEWLMGERRIF